MSSNGKYMQINYIKYLKYTERKTVFKEIIKPKLFKVLITMQSFRDILYVYDILQMLNIFTLSHMAFTFI